MAQSQETSVPCTVPEISVFCTRKNLLDSCKAYELPRVAPIYTLQ